MPSCCRCNGSGKCLNCACVKKGIHCTDCLPHCRGRCSNRTAGPGVASSNSSNHPYRWSWRRFVELVEPPAPLVLASLRRTRRALHGQARREPLLRQYPSPTRLLPLRLPLVVWMAPNTLPLVSFPILSPSLTGVFTWGELDSSAFSSSVKAAYSEILHWKRNIFAVPSGALGKRFVNELARLFCAYADASVLEGVALCAAMVMPALLLQCPHRSSKNTCQQSLP